MAKRKPKIESAVSIQPEDAQLRPSTEAKRFAFDDPKWGMVENDIYECWQGALSGRGGLDADLEVYNALYEMEHQGEQDSPWVGASNVIPPIIPGELEALRDYIIQAVFTPRLFLVSGRNAEARKHASLVEKWLNSLLSQERSGGECWMLIILSMIQASLRDGTAGTLITWFQRKETKPVVSFEPELDPTTGEMKLDDDNKPVKKRKISWIQEVIDEPLVELVTLKDVVLSPPESKSIQQAAMVFVTRLMYEEDLNQLMDGMGDDSSNGVFSREAIEMALSYVVEGQTDIPSDPQGTYDKDAGGQIDVGIGQGSLNSTTFRNRGPLEIRLGFSKQHDMNGDGRVERNIFFLHDRSQRLIGWVPYEYLMNKWPLPMFSCFPRIGQPYGYSVPERLADIVDSMAANKNQRINYNDMVVSPVLMKKSGDLVEDKGKIVQPGAEWLVEDPKGSLAYLQLNPVSGTSFQEDSQDQQLIAKVTGQAAPFTGGQSPTKQTATQTKVQAAAQTTRSNTIALFFRFFAREFINIVFNLYLQYSNDDMNFQHGEDDLVLPREVLALPYTINVAGIADPTDANARRQDMMIAVNEFPKIYPAWFQKPSNQRKLAMKLADTFPNFEDLEEFLGTDDDAKALDQAQQQAAQMQAQVAAQGQEPPQGGQGAQ